MSNEKEHVTATANAQYGYCAVCSCGWIGARRSIRESTGADRADHITTALGASPIVVPREPTWSVYP